MDAISTDPILTTNEVEDYLSTLTNRNTKSAYAPGLRAAQTALSAAGGLAAATPEQREEWIEKYKETVSDATLNRVRQGINSFNYWLTHSKPGSSPKAITATAEAAVPAHGPQSTASDSTPAAVPPAAKQPVTSGSSTSKNGSRKSASVEGKQAVIPGLGLARCAVCAALGGCKLGLPGLLPLPIRDERCQFTGMSATSLYELITPQADGTPAAVEGGRFMPTGESNGIPRVFGFSLCAHVCGQKIPARKSTGE